MNTCSRNLILPKALSFALASLIFWAVAVHAQLAVTVSPPKAIGTKIVVSLGMKNLFDRKIESARAVVFLLDQDGKMVGQKARWVIGETSTNGIPAGTTNIFNFVVTSDKPLVVSNLTAKVSFDRLNLEGGKAANPKTDVQVRAAEK